ncbi:hypothetical protein [uncultured Paracoccus sp.]|uniref:hypothetical protein n=1 Tax=uncultured Paracoccus sp. TaxID=189685 RepID=UPI002609FB7F|nr:hypothetical protein [uncultured Paracoccus sp.]
MIHQKPATDMAVAISDWHESVAIGDIIRWPMDAGNSLALVVEIETIGGWRVLTVAPGLDDRSQPVRPGTLRLTRMDEVRNSGLDRAVRFELDRRISISPQHPGLDAQGDTPVVGHLCETALDRLHAERARVHALRDIASARRVEQRNQRRIDRRTGWRPALRPAAASGQEDRA